MESGKRTQVQVSEQEQEQSQEQEQQRLRRLFEIKQRVSQLKEELQALE